MVRNSVFLLLFFLPVTLSAQTAEKSAHSTEQTRGSCYTNPILPGDYPDPYIFRDGDDFYMTHSLFEYYPGGADLAFQRLVHWEPVCRALHKNTYLLGIRDTYNQQR